MQKQLSRSRGIQKLTQIIAVKDKVRQTPDLLGKGHGRRRGCDSASHTSRRPGPKRHHQTMTHAYVVRCNVCELLYRVCLVLYCV
jgi:hypothetical protein